MATFVVWHCRLMHVSDYAAGTQVIGWVCTLARRRKSDYPACCSWTKGAYTYSRRDIWHSIRAWYGTCSEGGREKEWGREREREREREGCMVGVGMRSTGRFHFVSLAACGGAIAAALCQSVTLSRHPFYLARGLPLLPRLRFPFSHSLPFGGAGATWIKPRGCLTAWQAAFRSFSRLHTSPLFPSFYPSLTFHPRFYQEGLARKASTVERR